MRLNKENLLPKIEPYKGVLYFIIILLISHFFWKFTVKGDETENIITFFGLNITAPFTFMANHFANITFKILDFLGFEVQLFKGNILYYEKGVWVQIVPSCTGIKQAYIFFCIIAFTRGPWIKKLWFILLGFFAIYLFNIVRLTTIVGFCKNHFDWFDFLHSYLFKYLFYGMIFLLWVIWDEKIAARHIKKNIEQKCDE